MRRKYICCLPFLILSLFFLSCTSPIERIEKEVKISENEPVMRDIPVRMQEGGVTKELMTKYRRTLGLPSLEDGFYNFQLRIWEDLENPEYFAGRIIIIMNVKGKWSAELYNYKYLTPDSSYTPDSLAGQKVSLKKPPSGWNNLLNKLLDLQILTLPDFESIPKYFSATDQKYVTIEIATEKYYRFYEYPDPYIQKGISSAKKMVKILELVKKEFDLP